MDSRTIIVFPLWFWFCWGWELVILWQSLRSGIDIGINRRANILPVLSRSRSWLTVCGFICWAAIEARWSSIKEACRRPRIIVSAHLILGTLRRLPYILITMWCKSLALSIEILRWRTLILKRPISASHTVASMMCCFDRPISHIEWLLLISLALLRVAKAGTAWWLTNLHPWREGIFEENPSVLALTSIFGGASLLTIHASAWRNRVVVITIVRRNYVITLEVVSWDTLSLWMFLSAGCPWIEKVVNRLECSATLTRYLLVLTCKRIL